MLHSIICYVYVISHTVFHTNVQEKVCSIDVYSVCMLCFTGTARNCLNQPNVWLTVALTAILCVLPVVAYRFFYSQISPINDEV